MEGIGGNVTLKGRYRLVGRVESGDGRELWEGAGGEWPVPVVIQILGEPTTGELEVRRRRFEALRWPLLRHPNVEHILDMDEDGSTRFLVLRYWRGESIGDRMRRGESITLAEALLAGKAAADAVQAVHDLGQPLGGLSADDLMTNSDGRVIVTDMARTRLRPTIGPSPPLAHLEEERDLPGQGSNNGGLPPTMRQSDVVGLASLLYELITDHRPESAAEIDDVWAAEAPLFTPLESALPGVPLELARVCNSVLSGGAAARLLSAGALARVLDRVLNDLPSESSPDPGGSDVLEPSVSFDPDGGGIIDLQGTFPIVELPDTHSVDESSEASAQPIIPRPLQEETSDPVGSAVARAFWPATSPRNDAPKVTPKPSLWEPKSAEAPSHPAIEMDRATEPAIHWMREGVDEGSGRGIRVAIVAFVTLLIAALVAWAIIGPSKSPELRPARKPTAAGGAPATTAPPPTGPSPAVSVAPTATLQHMPDVLGMTVTEARDVLSGKGLRVKSVVPVEGAPSQIVRTDPASGTDVQPGTEVTLFVGVLPDRLTPSTPPG